MVAVLYDIRLIDTPDGFTTVIRSAEGSRVARILAEWPGPVPAIGQ